MVRNLKLRYKHRQWLWGYIFIFPVMFGFFFFMVYPMLSGIVLSFHEWSGIGEKQWVGIKNYVRLVKDTHFLKAVWNTVYYTLGILLIGVPLALLWALLLNQKFLKGRVIFRTIYYLPVISMMAAVSMLWKWLLSPNHGLVNIILGLFGLPKVNWLLDPRWAMPGLILMSIWKGTGFNMVIFLAGLQGIPKVYYEAAMIDGANRWQRFRHVTLPLLSPTTFFVIITTMIHSFQIFQQAYIVTEGGPREATTTIVYYIYKNAFEWFNMGYACAQAVFLLMILLLATLVQMRFQRRWVFYG